MYALASTPSDVLDYALSAFFVASGAGLAYMLIRMGGTFARLSSFIKGSERDLLPVIVKAGGTVDRVNDQLDKLDSVTDSAVAMADNADTAVRAVSTAITTPVKKVSGLAAAVSHGFSAFRARREPPSISADAALRRAPPPSAVRPPLRHSLPPQGHALHGMQRDHGRSRPRGRSPSSPAS